MSTPVVANTIPEIRAAITEARAQHPDRSVVLVPTMGALHEGHISLVQAARSIPGAFVVVSIFVNPLQFAEGEDLDAYPRTLDSDVEKLAGLADAVFAPAARDMYPEGPRTTVQPGPDGRILEGVHRPTHFAGVLTVVHKLFSITGCDHAVFGEKDYQQLWLIRQMVRDLNMDVEVHGSPIVREPAGLALSSRNTYLSDADRTLALELHRALDAASEATTEAEALRRAWEVLAATPEIRVDYLEVHDFDGPRLLVAARVGTTRLIDNAALPRL